MFCVTYAVTSLICFSLSVPLNAGMPPPPFSTCFFTAAASFADGIAVRSGPPLPPVPAAPWQPAQLSENTDFPAAGSPVCFSSPSPLCVVPAPAPQIPFGTTAGELAHRHTRVTRWDQSFEKHNNALDANGLMTTAAGPIALEDGVQAEFAADPVGGEMKIADWWSFEARTVDGSVQELAAAPPMGVRHVYVPLAVVSDPLTGRLAETAPRSGAPR